MSSDRETSKKAPPQRSAKARGGDQEMGQALRSVYQQTIDEQIPPEMLDLLGKLE
ncbi:NepR family anti-sigma factor [Sphingomonas sp. 28-63-12]|uniref:NepR family anti-sigma factor n=1 Tax=Sphingomonas sp. 28-63-12 TaxID=1970434 RepID=UPI0035A85B03